MRICLEEDAGHYELIPELEMTRKPLRMDALLVKTEDRYEMKGSLGRLFRKYNILEYKGYGDYLSIDDYYKGFSYALLYKAGVVIPDKRKTEQIRLDELTLTFVCYRYPRKLMHYLLQEKNYKIEEIDAGIYWILGEQIPVQIIVQKHLNSVEYKWLSNLSGELTAVDFEALVREADSHTSDVFRDELIQFLLESNERLKEDEDMCQFAEGLRNEGRSEGESYFAKLAGLLLEDSRIKDLQEAVADIEFRKKLYKEYGM